jgi:tetratricopeptide (TPR) repeat protein
METVVEENPLSLATSRMVMTEVLTITIENSAYRRCPLELQAVAGGHYSTVKSLSRLLALVLLALLSGMKAQTAPAQHPSPGPQQLFQQGESALKQNNLDLAERSFRGVLALDPQAAGAYANLGVIYMRRKKWAQALEMLHKAEHLAPRISGIRLNVGLTYYRQNNFRAAITPFESVVHDVPDSYQARYLLGLCYFFTERYTDAITMLEPLWPQASSQLNYLYVLGIAAGKSARPDLEQRAFAALAETGQDSPELHLLLGKAHINRQEYDEAIKELDLAARANPKLPFVHFNLGIAYYRKQDLARARDEFLKDVAIEPDLAYNYDQLGLVNSQLGNNQEAERNLRQALRLDPSLSSSHYQLAQVYQRQAKYVQALAEIDAAAKLDPGNSSIHYLRGQLLQRLGRTREARAEMEATTRMMNEQRDKRQKELYGRPAPNPELTQEPR